MVHLGHPPDASTPEPRILVAIPPAVHSPLDQASLAPERGVELRQRPADSVALSLVLQAVPPVLILRAAGARVYAVLRLELGRQLIRVHRLNVATNRVFHLYAITRVLERDPLHPVLILPDYQGVVAGIGPGAAFEFTPPGADLSASERCSVLIPLGRA